jgi:hypothetical protein
MNSEIVGRDPRALTYRRHDRGSVQRIPSFVFWEYLESAWLVDRANDIVLTASGASEGLAVERVGRDVFSSCIKTGQFICELHTVIARAY